MNLAATIKKTEVTPGNCAFFFLGQAGFCIKFSNGRTLFLDAYLTDSCYRICGFKRMTPTVIRPKEVSADIFFSTHNHPDHLDPDALDIIAGNESIHFLGGPDCAEIYLKAGIPPTRYGTLKCGQEKEICGLKLKAVYADHGDLAPEAIGVTITYDGITIYNTGDTAFTPDKIIPSLASEVDVMIAPINGAFGNMNGTEACRLAGIVKPRIVIPVHFWMFVEQNGNPAEFLKAAEKLPAGTKPLVMAPGEKFVYRK